MSNLYSIHLNESDLDGILRLRTIVAKLSSKAKMAQYPGAKREHVEITLNDVIELANCFQWSLEHANNFWREIDHLAWMRYINKI